MKKLILLCATLLIAACTAVPVVVPTPVTPPPIVTPAVTPCASGVWCYDGLVNAALTAKLLASDPGAYCPKYASLADKHIFWDAFEKAVSKSESGWKPTDVYQENFKDDVTGKLALSVGLFQLSVGDVPNYPNTACSAMTAANITDVKVNIGCDMAIQDKLAGSRATLRASLGRYWSTIRDDSNVSAQVQKYAPQCFGLMAKRVVEKPFVKKHKTGILKP